MLALLIVLASFSSNVYPQTARVNINVSNISVKGILNEIEKQTNYLFVYNSDEVDINKKHSLDMKESSVKDVLSNVFRNTNIVFYQEGNNIVLQLSNSKDDNKKTITGVIYDDLNEPLIGASVKIDGTTSGTMTDIDGKFSISTTKGSTLIVSYLGFTNQKITVTDKNEYSLVMQPDARSLNTVVVTALGIKREQKALSYNVQEFKQDDITTVKDANFVNALAGKVAGVTINTSSSGVGGASKVIMRGTKSINQSSNALYVIDGVPMFNLSGGGSTEFGSAGVSEAIADINPEDIESMSVLTGPAAAALYGSDASNGAIMITTKKGKAGYTNVVMTQNTDFLNPLSLPQFQNRYGTGTQGALAATDRSWGPLLNSANYIGYSPKNDFYKTGVVATQSVSLSTGTDKNQTYASVASVNSQGLVANNSYDRYNFTIRNTTSLLNDKMKVDVGGSYIYQNDMNMINQGVYSNPLVTAYLFPRGNDWQDVVMFEHYNTQRRISVQNWTHGINEFVGQNPYWIAYRNLREYKKDRYMFNANISYDILPWLNIAGRAKLDHSKNNFTDKRYATTNTTLTDGSNNGFYGIQHIMDKQVYADFLFNINKQFSEDISYQSNIGAAYTDTQNDVTEISGPIVDTELMSGIPNKFAIVQLDRDRMNFYEDGFRDQTQSIFASAELGYKGAYYLTLTGRNDWPSQLAGHASTQASFFYPSVGTSFVLSEIIPMPKKINYMKARISYASVGLPFTRGLGAIRSLSYEWDRAGRKYSTESTYPMSNLKPERTNSWEVGLTTRFLENFSLDVSYYDSKTYNQTFNPEISAGSGYQEMYIQTGSVLNRGVELSLGYSNKWNDFHWSSNYVFSANKNKIVELADNWKNPITGEIVNIETLNIGGLADARFLLRKGGSLGDLYSLADLLRDENGDIYVSPQGEVTKINAENPIKLGSVFPKANMSWRNDFSWKNFNLGFMFSARLGGVVYSATQAIMDRYGVSEASALARDNGGAVINGNDYVNPEKWFSVIGASSGIPQFYTYDATNIRLLEASVGYTFSRDKLWGIGEATISLVGRNLLMIYNKAPFDPEAVATTGNYYQGIDYFMIPSTRNMGFSIRMKF